MEGEQTKRSEKLIAFVYYYNREKSKLTIKECKSGANILRKALIRRLVYLKLRLKQKVRPQYN